ncbi:MAG TPA: type II secretion system F family protein [Xanthobacteraceae bacterium]|nr:type II secretion system F family protein [Xanthobacteraceae bacterium]
MAMQSLAMFALVGLAAGGIIWVFVYPILSGERQAEKRQESVIRSEPSGRVAAAAAGRNAPKVRRDIEETLKELEVRQQKQKNLPLAMRISQAGLSWTKRQFIIISVGIGFVLFALIFTVGGGVLAAAGAAFAGGFGVPRWLLIYLKKRRENAFLHNFPDAVDVVVRGVKAGLPLGDCLRIISNEAPEPVKSEFQTVVESQAVGITMGDACAKLYERMPLPEANFFGIVVSIQQRAGGNLSEALGNLSRVLRDRKKMKAKIQAMSMEAKASAVIIAALPFAVMILVYISSPNYIELLWTHPTGRLMMACCAAWMLIGVFVMKKMINFDF